MPFAYFGGLDEEIEKKFIIIFCILLLNNVSITFAAKSL